MNAARGVRGQPVLVMAVIIGSWLAVRALLWEMPLEAQAKPQGAKVRQVPAGQLPIQFSAGGTSVEIPPSRKTDVGAIPFARSGDVSLEFGLALREQQTRRKELASSPNPLSPTQATAGFPPFGLVPDQEADAVGVFPSPADNRRSSEFIAVADRPLLGFGDAQEPASPSRWAGDAWLLWREGSRAAVAPGITAYGRSQAGAVLRFRPWRDRRLLPTVYVRATSALDSPRQGELAAGLSVRPVPAIPVSIAAEGRITDTDSGREVRPAAFAVTQLPPIRFPLDLEAEAYLQAGYVGGRYKTAFVDGQGRISRRLTGPEGGAELRAGLATWGGAQRDTSRLDIGPSATLSTRIGEVTARLSADYRVRVAGGAEPRSGPALTLSAGF